MYDERYIMIAQDLHKCGNDVEFLRELNEASTDLEQVTIQLSGLFGQGVIDDLARKTHEERLTNPVYRELSERFAGDLVTRFTDAYQWWEALVQDLWKYCEDESYVQDCANAEIKLIDAWAALGHSDINEIAQLMSGSFIARCTADWGYPKGCER